MLEEEQRKGPGAGARLVSTVGTSLAGTSGTRTGKRGSERGQEDRSCRALLALEGLWLLFLM